MSRRLVAGFAALGIAVATFFLVRSANDNVEYYLYPNEAVARRADFADGRRFRLAGVVVPRSLADAGNTHTFAVSDGEATVDVRLVATPPPLFDEDVPVLLSGSWEGETFVADEALIRHEEGYAAPEAGNFPEGGAAG